MLWAAAWLYQATNNEHYLSYLANNGDALGGTGWDMTEFGWDVKYAGVQVLVSKVGFFVGVLVDLSSELVTEGGERLSLLL